jgi:hypothetical protein
MYFSQSQLVLYTPIALEKTHTVFFIFTTKGIQYEKTETYFLLKVS